MTFLVTMPHKAAQPLEADSVAAARELAQKMAAANPGCAVHVLDERGEVVWDTCASAGGQTLEGDDFDKIRFADVQAKSHAAAVAERERRRAAGLTEAEDAVEEAPPTKPEGA